MSAAPAARVRVADASTQPPQNARAQSAKNAASAPDGEESS